MIQKGQKKLKISKKIEETYSPWVRTNTSTHTHTHTLTSCSNQFASSLR